MEIPLAKDLDSTEDRINSISIHKEVLKGIKIRDEKLKNHESYNQYDLIDIDFTQPSCSKSYRSQLKRTLMSVDKENSYHSVTSKRRKKRVKKNKKYKHKDERKKCGIRIAELAVPSKRHCIDTWRSRCDTLPTFMVDRLRKIVMDEKPIVHVQDAIYCFKQKQSKISRSFFIENKIPESIKDREIKILCAIFGSRVSVQLQAPRNVTISPRLSTISEIVNYEISRLLYKRKNTNYQKKIQLETANKITNWIADILEQSFYNLTLDDYNELEKEEGHIWDIIDDIFDGIVLPPSPEPSSSSLEAIAESSSSNLNSLTNEETNTISERSSSDDIIIDEFKNMISNIIEKITSSSDIKYEDSKMANEDDENEPDLESIELFIKNYLSNYIDEVNKNFNDEEEYEDAIHFDDVYSELKDKSNDENQDIILNALEENSDAEVKNIKHIFDINVDNIENALKNDSLNEAVEESKIIDNNQANIDIMTHNINGENKSDEELVNLSPVRSRIEENEAVEESSITDNNQANIDIMTHNINGANKSDEELVNLSPVRSRIEENEAVEESSITDNNQANIDIMTHNINSENKSDEELINLSPDRSRIEENEAVKESSITDNNQANIDIMTHNINGENKSVEELVNLSPDRSRIEENEAVEESSITDNNQANIDTRTHNINGETKNDEELVNLSPDRSRIEDKQFPENNEVMDEVIMDDKTEFKDDVIEEKNDDIVETLSLKSVTSDYSIKKVKFSNMDLGKGELSIQSIFTHKNNKKSGNQSIHFSEPNNSLLSKADESWPENLVFPVVKVTVSVSKSILSLGKINEVEENNIEDDKLVKQNIKENLALKTYRSEVQIMDIKLTNNDSRPVIKDATETKNIKSDDVEQNYANKNLSNEQFMDEILTNNAMIKDDLDTKTKELQRDEEISNKNVVLQNITKNYPIISGDNKDINNVSLEKKEVKRIVDENINCFRMHAVDKNNKNDNVLLSSVIENINMNNIDIAGGILQKINYVLLQNNWCNCSLLNENFINETIIQAVQEVNESSDVVKNKANETINVINKKRPVNLSVEHLSVIVIYPEKITQNIKCSEKSIQKDEPTRIRPNKYCKYSECEVRTWCQGLVNVIQNLELWLDWIDNSSSNLLHLKRKEKFKPCCKIKQNNNNRKWIKLKGNIDSDAKLWKQLSIKLQVGLRSYEHFYKRPERQQVNDFIPKPRYYN